MKKLLIYYWKALSRTCIGNINVVCLFRKGHERCDTFMQTFNKVLFLNTVISIFLSHIFLLFFGCLCEIKITHSLVTEHTDTQSIFVIEFYSLSLHYFELDVGYHFLEFL